MDMDTVNRTDQIMKRIRAAQGKQTLGDRVDDTLSGLLNSYAAGCVNALGTAAQVVNAPENYRLQISRLQRVLEDGGYSDGVWFHHLTEENRKSIQDLIRRMADKAWKLEQPDSFANRTQALADQMRDDSAAFIASAKDGLNGFGQAIVDTSVIGGQMIGDMALGKLSGIGSSLPMAIRIFGDVAQETRQDGLNLDQQLLIGLGSAGIAYAAGMLPGVSNILLGKFDKVKANKFVEGLVKKYGLTAAAQIMQSISQSVAGEIALSALRDGGEALVADAFQARLKEAIYGPDVQFDEMNPWYDFLAAAILGGFGKIVKPLGAAANQANGAAASGP